MTLRNRLQAEPARGSRVLGHLHHDPARRRQQHLQQADAEDDQQEVRVDAPLRLEEERRELAERAGDDGAPERVDAADQRRGEQRERVLRREAERRRLTELRGQQAAGHAGRERREREGPQLVADDVHARRERRRLALADRGPGAPGLRWRSARRSAGT